MLKSFAEGYKPQVDWGGTSGDAALTFGKQQVRLTAWRKKLLYIILAAVGIISIVNFLATLWLLSRVNFNAEGLGSLHVEVAGLHLKGVSWMASTTNTGKIQSREEDSVQLLGYHNTSLIAVDDDMNLVTAMVLDTKDLLVYAASFSVSDAEERKVFYADQTATSVDTETFTITGEDGALFEDSTQTPRLLASRGQQLDLESGTRDVQLKSNKELSIEARDGDINAVCRKSLSLSTEEGMIRFLTPSIYMPHLELHGEDHQEISFSNATATNTTPQPETQIVAPLSELATTTQSPVFSPDPDSLYVYQVCVCPSGRIFLADAKSYCIPDKDTCR